MSGCCDAGGGAQAGFPGEGAGRPAWPRVQGSLRPLPAQLPPPIPCLPLMSRKPRRRRAPAPLLLLSAARSTPSESQLPLSLSFQACQSVRKRAERSEPVPQLCDARLELAAAAPPSRAFSPAGGDAGSAAALPGPCSRPGRAPVRGGRHTRGSGFSKHTFVSTHDTGARAHTLQARAHSPAGCRRRAPAVRRRIVAASALGAPLGPRPASAPGCGEPWRSGRTPGSLPPWRRPNAPSSRDKAAWGRAGGERSLMGPGRR
ncbi:ESX-1 secretion-associated protein EspI-like isoform X1 [Cervus elaphus]|uniref:ESX-1 secretion-associated protein EspI-like isoform X1 n=1 Tax=Cervus elaphus TaxID=9860 RepID=UPI001CC2A5CC|nr:ESX-1 secretion-associated protein EspI-like isoform X1 [Cervus elaphus]